ncbi:hypothetical protein K6V43_10050, partial [Streptococcus suis]|nr:hypothetical protein [Streptococcus suis]
VFLDTDFFTLIDSHLTLLYHSTRKYARNIYKNLTKKIALYQRLEHFCVIQTVKFPTRGSLTGSALQNIDWLRDIQAYADGKIEILVGGGLTTENVPTLLEALPINQIHGTRLFW